MKPADFTLTEDGVPQKLSAVTETDATAEAPLAQTAPEPLPPNTFAVQPPIAGDLPRTVIVLGALSFASAPQARDDLKKFMKTVPAGVPIAILKATGRASTSFRTSPLTTKSSRKPPTASESCHQLE